MLVIILVLLSVGLCVQSINPFPSHLQNHISEIDPLVTTIAAGLKCFVRSGTVDGIPVFHSDSVLENDYNLLLRIADVKMVCEFIFLGKDSILPDVLKYFHTISMRPSENVIDREFIAYNYANPYNNRHAYFQEEFVEKIVCRSGSSGLVNYINLNLRVCRLYHKGSNNNCSWNQNSAMITITSLHPWYATVSALIIYILIIALLISVWRIYDLKRIRLQNKLDMEHAEAEKLRQIDHMKTEFFTNISHEFRTPLTLILGPLENIIQGTYIGDLQKEAEMMKRNARRLLRLINQILDLSKLDAGKMKIRAFEQDLSEFVRQVAANFESKAHDKNLTFKVYVPHKPIFIFFDSEKMETIIHNVIDNAIKFTPAGGKVSIRLGLHKVGNPRDTLRNMPMARITIYDNGIGIPKDDLDKIFDRFYKVNTSHVRKYAGAGIGLALVRELVLLHHGYVGVKSTLGKGTSFFLLFPMGKSHLADAEIVSVSDSPYDSLAKMGDFPEDKGLSFKTLHEKPLKISDHLPQILVVEDNNDMRQYITRNLDHEYGFIEARNGLQGFNKAVETMPDLIISDLMMPGMDGFELCRKIREDERTRHIPVIMLTARAGRDHLISGYENGIDDYIIKPFDRNVLLARIRNLLNERKLLREKYIRHWIRDGINIVDSTADDKFIQRINEILELHYMNPEFGTRLFIKEIGLSRSVLYRKLKALTNLSPNSYIRNFRLIKAYQLIFQDKSDIGTTAYNCGFNNLSYFSRSFKQLFKKSPHDFSTQSKL